MRVIIRLLLQFVVTHGFCSNFHFDSIFLDAVRTFYRLKYIIDHQKSGCWNYLATRNNRKSNTELYCSSGHTLALPGPVKPRQIEPDFRFYFIMQRPHNETWEAEKGIKKLENATSVNLNIPIYYSTASKHINLTRLVERSLFLHLSIAVRHSIQNRGRRGYSYNTGECRHFDVGQTIHSSSHCAKYTRQNLTTKVYSKYRKWSERKRVVQQF